MKGWVTRDLDGMVLFHAEMPHEHNGSWDSNLWMTLNRDAYPDVTFENSPREKELKLTEL